MPWAQPEWQGRLQELARLITFFTLNNRTIKKKKKAPLKLKNKKSFKNLMQFPFPGRLRERKSQCCLHRPGASLEGLWESPACLPQFSTLTAAEHFQCAQHTVQTPSHSALSPPHAFFAEITTTHNSKKLQKDTHYSRKPSLVFLKYMTLDIRFHFSSHFAIPSLKCIPICAFFSEHQACKLLFQAKKSLKEVTPQRKGSAHFLRGSYYIEYPWEMKYSHLDSPLFWHWSCSLG